MRTAARQPWLALRSADGGLLDGSLVLAWLLCLGIGTVMVASASLAEGVEKFGEPLHFLLRHAVYLVLATAGLLIAALVPLPLWQRLAPWLFVAGLAALVLVLVPGVGREAKGSSRWLGIGSASVQPSELMKFVFVLFLARHVARQGEDVRSSMSGVLKPLVLGGVVAFLLLLEPDFGTAVVLGAVSFLLLFLAGARLRDLGLLLGLAMVGAGLLAVLQPYRVDRLVAFVDPWAVQFQSGYQLTQALIAFGQGEVFGQGLGHSVQKLLYLPEAHTDFLLAVIAEELGLVGVLLVLLVLATLVLKGLLVGRRASVLNEPFRACVAWGAALFIGVQFLVSVGVNTGLLPTKGLTLPLVSYGGNSLIASSMLIGLLLRADFDNRSITVVAAAKAKDQPKTKVKAKVKGKAKTKGGRRKAPELAGAGVMA